MCKHSVTTTEFNGCGRRVQAAKAMNEHALNEHAIVRRTGRSLCSRPVLLRVAQTWYAHQTQLAQQDQTGTGSEK
jgi:hypothetical protein